jgi:RNA polymerase sigma factor (sigma-70 family)
MSDDSTASVATRQTLLARLKDWGDQDSWRTFFDTYWKLIYSVATKSGLSAVEAQDVVKETVLSVARKMQDFKYDAAGSFKGWLLQLIRWRILGQLRKRGEIVSLPESAAGDLGETDFILRVPDPAGSDLEKLWDEEWHKNLMEVALAKVKHRCNPREYQMFDLYVLNKMPVRKVAQTLGVSVTHVYVAKHRVGSLLKNEIRAAQNRMI